MGACGFLCVLSSERKCQGHIFKLRLGALIPRSVGWTDCLSVCRSVGPPIITKKIIKLFKTSKYRY